MDPLQPCRVLDRGQPVAQLRFARIAPPAKADRSARVGLADAHRAEYMADLARSAAAGATEREGDIAGVGHQAQRSEEHPSELQSLMRISYDVHRLNKKSHNTTTRQTQQSINTRR